MLYGGGNAPPMDGLVTVASYDELLDSADAIYVVSPPERHYADTRYALEAGRHVLCESPLGLSGRECWKLLELATSKKRILLEGLKTAYCTAFERLVLLAKSGRIGDVVSVDAVCTSLQDAILHGDDASKMYWNSISEWGGLAMLPIFQILGTEYNRMTITTRVDFTYPHAVASIKVGKGIKSEGDLVVSGTRGYIYVPAPWWKTDYFELRYEHQEDAQKHYHILQGEGIRNNIVAFVKSIEQGEDWGNVPKQVSAAIADVIGDFYTGQDVQILQ